MTLLHLMTVLNCRCVLQKDELKPVKEVAPASPPQAMDISQSEAFSKHLLPVNVQDIDQDDGDNPQLVAEYVNDIYDYMRQLEVDSTSVHYVITLFALASVFRTYSWICRRLDYKSIVICGPLEANFIVSNRKVH